MRFKHSIISLLLFMSQSFTIALKCDNNGYTQAEGVGWYKFHTQAKNWFEASIACVKEGAHLAIINSEEEYKVIVEMIDKEWYHIRNTMRPDLAWLGVHRTPNNSTWVTSLGEPLSSTGFVKWSTGCNGYPPEPNNDGGDEYCVSLLHICDQGFDDHPCDTTLGFVCEKFENCV